MKADFVIGIPQNGGARPGAGRKPAGYEKPQEVIDFEKARAANESAKARKNEIEAKVMEGAYVAREAVQQAAATTIASLAQTLRSIPDNLERKGVASEVCATVEKVIDEAMREAASQMALMAGEPG